MEEQTNQGQYQGGNEMMKPNLPNHVGVLVLGILSIVFCWCYGLVGIILGVVALALASKSELLYKENPEGYAAASYSNLKAGRICAIIGTVLSGLYLIFIIIYIVFIGSLMTSVPWYMYN